MRLRQAKLALADRVHQLVVFSADDDLVAAAASCQASAFIILHLLDLREV